MTKEDEIPVPTQEDILKVLLELTLINPKYKEITLVYQNKIISTQKELDKIIKSRDQDEIIVHGLRLKTEAEKRQGK